MNNSWYITCSSVNGRVLGTSIKYMAQEIKNIIIVNIIYVFGVYSPLTYVLIKLTMCRVPKRCF